MLARCSRASLKMRLAPLLRSAQLTFGSTHSANAISTARADWEFLDGVLQNATDEDLRFLPALRQVRDKNDWDTNVDSFFTVVLTNNASNASNASNNAGNSSSIIKLLPEDIESGELYRTFAEIWKVSERS